MSTVFAEEKSKGILLVDASNAFNPLNRAVALWNIQHLCPVFKPGIRGLWPRMPGFLKLFRPQMLVCLRACVGMFVYVCVCVCVCVCVSAPEAINNKSRERHA